MQSRGPSIVFEVLRRPRPALESIGRESRLGSGIAVVAIWAALGLILTLLSGPGGGLSAGQFPELPPAAFRQLERGLRVFVPLSAVLFPFVWWLGASSLMFLTVRLFGGRASLSCMLAVVGVACAPWVAGYLVQIPLVLLQLALEGGGTVPAILGALTLIVSAAALVWHVALVILGARLAAGTSPGGAAASCALAGLGCATAALFLALTLVTLAIGLSRGVGGP